jgi:hypothetical protein
MGPINNADQYTLQQGKTEALEKRLQLRYGSQASKRVFTAWTK